MQRDPERPSYRQKWIERLAPGYFTNMWPENTPKAPPASHGGLSFPPPLPIGLISRFAIFRFCTSIYIYISNTSDTSTSQRIAQVKTVTCIRMWAKLAPGEKQIWPAPSFDLRSVYPDSIFGMERGVPPVFPPGRPMLVSILVSREREFRFQVQVIHRYMCGNKILSSLSQACKQDLSANNVKSPGLINFIACRFCGFLLFHEPAV